MSTIVAALGVLGTVGVAKLVHTLLIKDWMEGLPTETMQYAPMHRYASFVTGGYLRADGDGTQSMIEVLAKYMGAGEGVEKVVACQILGDPIILHADPAWAELLLTADFSQDKSRQGYEQLKVLLGENGLVSANGDLWRRQRSILNGAFHRDNLVVFVDAMHDVIGKVVDYLGDVSARRTSLLGGREPFDADELMGWFTLDIITTAMFSASLGMMDARRKEKGVPRLVHALMAGMEEATERMFNPFRKWNPLAAWRNFRNIQYIESEFRTLIRGRVAERAGRKGERARDMIDLMLDARDAETGEALSEAMMIDQCKTFVFAGSDTTAHTLAMALRAVAMHPEVARKIRDEVAAVEAAMDGGGGGRFSLADINKMRYVEAVLKETLRMYPPVAFFTRRAAEDYEFQGHHVKAETSLSTCVLHLHYDPEYWDEPFKFVPERFFGEINKWAFLPFSLRRRVCIGMNFAMLEMKLALAVLVQKFDFDVDPRAKFHIFTRITSAPKDGLWLIATTPRHATPNRPRVLP